MTTFFISNKNYILGELYGSLRVIPNNSAPFARSKLGDLR